MISKPVTTELESGCLNRIRAAETASQSHSDKNLQIQLIFNHKYLKIIKKKFEMLFEDRGLIRSTRNKKREELYVNLCFALERRVLGDNYLERSARNRSTTFTEGYGDNLSLASASFYQSG